MALGLLYHKLDLRPICISIHRTSKVCAVSFYDHRTQVLFNGEPKAL